jgi:CRISPR-associated protein Cas1
MPVNVDQELIDVVLAAADKMRQAARTRSIPPPLQDSPKCWGCSLASICLPDEVALIQKLPSTGRPTSALPEDAPVQELPDEAEALEDPPLRLLYPARDEGMPLHVATQGAYISKSGEELVVKYKGEVLGRARLPSTSAVSIYGMVQFSTQALRDLTARGVPIHFHSQSGWHDGYMAGHNQPSLVVRRAQFRLADSPGGALALAKRFVRTKVANQRTFLRRNAEPAPKETLATMKRALQRLEGASTLEELMGFEGEAAAAYFSAFGALLLPRQALDTAFAWEKRNRRPPTDAVNAMLSFAYALLAGLARTAVMKAGFDPMLGFLHSERPGRPALALDFMEEFRPVLADSVAITMINTGEIQPGHFVERSGAVNLNDHGRKKVIEAFEQRLDSLVSHPVFGYRVSWRKILEIQARLLARHVAREIAEYPEIRIT